MHGELICNVLKNNGTSPVSVVISATIKRFHKHKESLCRSASTWGDKEIFLVSPISGRGSNPSSPQLSGGAVGLKTIGSHINEKNDDVSDSVASDYDHVDTAPLKGVANILLLKTSDRGGELGLPGKGKDVHDFKTMDGGVDYL